MPADLLKSLPRPVGGEACAILLGISSGDRLRVVRLLQARNISEDPRGFVVDPLDIVRARVEAESSGLEILGIYHSHPAGEPVPSPRDVEGMLLWPLAWVIASPEGLGAWAACPEGLKKMRILVSGDS